MTEQQAIEYFRMRLRERTHPPTTAQQKAFTLAIPALENLVPEKAQNITTDIAAISYSHGYCPRCGKGIFHATEEAKFCRYCGKRVTWED